MSISPPGLGCRRAHSRVYALHRCEHAPRPRMEAFRVRLAVKEERGAISSLLYINEIMHYVKT